MFSSACQGTARRWVSFCFLLCSFLAWLSFSSCSRPSCLCFFLSARSAIFSRNARRVLFADWSSSISARISFSTSKEDPLYCERRIHYMHYYIQIIHTCVFAIQMCEHVFCIRVAPLRDSGKCQQTCCRRIRLRPLIAAAWLHGLCTRARLNFTGASEPEGETDRYQNPAHLCDVFLESTCFLIFLVLQHIMKLFLTCRTISS